MSVRTPFEALQKRAATRAVAEQARPVSPAIARLFRNNKAMSQSDKRNAHGVENNPAVSPSAQAVPERQMEQRIEQRQEDSRKSAFETSPSRARVSQPKTDALANDALFRKRIALQRASNAWGPLLAAWSAAPASAHGTWTLARLVSAIREEIDNLANAAVPGGATDDRLRLAFTTMMTRYLAGEIRCAARTNHHLAADAVANAALDLASFLEEPPSATLREPNGEAVITRGHASLTISLMDASARLLPVLARHAGSATRDELEGLLKLTRGRAWQLTNEILDQDANERDRQSLFQSFLRREVELLAAALETLPAGGPGSLNQGRKLLEDVIDTYQRWSNDARRAVTACLEAEPSVASKTHSTEFPAP